MKKGRNADRQKVSLSRRFPLFDPHTHTNAHKHTHIQWARWRCWLEEQLPSLDRSAVYLNRSVRIMGSKSNMIATWPSDKKTHYYFPVSTHRNTHIWRYSTHTYLGVHTHSYKLTVDALSIKRQTVAIQMNEHTLTNTHSWTQTDRHIHPHRSIIWVICTLKLVKTDSASGTFSLLCHCICLFVSRCESPIETYPHLQSIVVVSDYRVKKTRALVIMALLAHRR